MVSIKNVTLYFFIINIKNALDMYYAYLLFVFYVLKYCFIHVSTETVIKLNMS